MDRQAYIELAEFRYRLRKFLHFSEEAAKGVGITPNQHQLLLAIAGFPDRSYITPTEAAERLQIKHHSCLGLIGRCEKLGLIRRFDNPDDGRSVYVALTEQGETLLKRLTEMHQLELDRLGLTHRNFLQKDLSVFEGSTASASMRGDAEQS
ncbi:MAG: MarR family transcriptional regulator [Alicyclobacillaceae bacterium]|uniref:MarR family winged helix-turn-helix transcriptional regulator n=1 Tax=Alicyclobacillus sp. SP_1 TaxID=2942475 RepID=UPI0021575A22|nr:MarR family transcriptional regulator [Alicyclobacillus sp. SP_1]MCY0887123.1 MarR family transcriptional regulator [Alicyclobacillaceae bacterium]MCY0895396.1 MarR family transcriptional regulator [Alicyclobacillaceae bacterium]